jgi:hypothetical protein
MYKDIEYFLYHICETWIKDTAILYQFLGIHFCGGRQSPPRISSDIISSFFVLFRPSHFPTPLDLSDVRELVLRGRSLPVSRHSFVWRAPISPTHIIRHFSSCSLSGTSYFSNQISAQCPEHATFSAFICVEGANLPHTYNQTFFVLLSFRHFLFFEPNFCPVPRTCHFLGILLCGGRQSPPHK